MNLWKDFLKWANQDKKHQLYATAIGVAVFFLAWRILVEINS